MRIDENLRNENIRQFFSDRATLTVRGYVPRTQNTSP